MGVITTGPLTVTTTASLGSRLRRTVAQFSNGNRIMVVPTATAGGNTQVWFSVDAGANWSVDATVLGAATGGLDYPEVFVDQDDYVHVVGMDDSAVEYWRGTPNAGRTAISSWQGPYSPLNASTQGYPSIVAHREGTGWAAHIVWSRYWTTETGYWEYRCRCTTTSIGDWVTPCDYGVCPNHGHTTYTSWSTSQWNCVCGGDCHALQNGWHTHGGCACSHVHYCSSAVQESQWVSTGSDTDNRVYYARYSISDQQVVALQQSATVISTDYNQSEDTYPVIDFNHAGDAKSVAGGTPHLYVAWEGSNSLRFKKATYSGGTWNWGTERTLTATATNAPRIDGIFDGTRFVMAADISTTPYIHVEERNAADSASTNRTPPALSARPTAVAVTYNSEGDIILVAEDAGTPKFVKYDRSADSWGSWSTIEAISNIVGAPGSIGLKRGQSGQSTEVTYIQGAGSPYNVRYFAEKINNLPTNPTWVTASGTFDVASGLTLDWDFQDPDLPNDSQGSYTLRRRIGAGAFNYWNGSTWQASEDGSTKITTTTTQVSLASSWGNDGDADHYFSVKTWDANDEGPSGWSAELQVTPSAKDNPTITALTTIPAAEYPITWTVATQTKYRVRTYTDVGGAQGSLIYDSGIVVSTNTGHVTPFPVNGAVRWVEVVTWNDEGLESDPSADQVTVDYEGPAAPVITTGVFYDITGDPQDQPEAGVEVTIFTPKSNLLDYDTASIEATTNGWTPTGTTLARVTDFAVDGAWGLRGTKSGAGNMMVTGTNFVTVTEGTDYTFRLESVAAATARSVQATIVWYDNAQAFLSQDSSLGVNNATQVEVSVTATAPAGAAYAKPRFYAVSTADAEVHYFDAFSLHEADGTTYFRRGFTGILADTVDLYRRLVPPVQGELNIIEGDLRTHADNITGSYPIQGGTTETNVAAAQGLLPSRSRYLSAARLRFRQTGTPLSDLRLRVMEGDILAGKELANVVVIPANVGNGNDQTVTFTLGTPVLLRKDETYYLVVERTGNRDATNYHSLLLVAADVWSKMTPTTADVGRALALDSGVWTENASNYDIDGELDGYVVDADVSPIRVAVDLSQSSIFNDYTVASGKVYEYRGRSFTNANGSSTDGEWTL